MMRVGIIGACGHGGTAFAGRCPVEFAGAAPGYTDAEAVRSMARTHGIPYYETPDELFEHCDAVVIHTVFAKNAALSIRALERGLHVYAEKPAATNLRELDELERAAKASGKRYFSMLTLRYDPWFATARRLCHEGAIGEPRLISAQKSYKLGERPAFYSDRALYGGTIPWIGIHIIDLALWLTGLSCEEVSARHSRAGNGGNGSMEATSAIRMTLTGGVQAQLHTDFLRPESAPTHGDDRIRIAGTRGVLEVRDDRVWLLNEAHDGSAPVDTDTVPEIFDDFVTLALHPELETQLHRGIDAFDATRIALLARDDADAHE